MEFELEINAILVLKPLYALFKTVAKLFEHVGAKYTTLHAFALPQCSNCTQPYERKHSFKSKTSSSSNSLFPDQTTPSGGLSTQYYTFLIFLNTI